MSEDNNMHELIIEAALENMDEVQDFVSGHMEDCPMNIQNQISIAVDEIFSNIARYAYNPDTGGATVRVAIGDDVTIEFEDSGTAFNPLAAGNPDLTLSAEEREVGGLGLFMVKKMMDAVEYRRDGNKNILTIKKKIGYADKK